MITPEKISELTAAGAYFFPDLPIELYHDKACPGVSNTGLSKVARSPAHYLAYKSSPSERKNWGDLGNAVHVGALQPELFPQKYIGLPATIVRKEKDGSETVMACTFATKEGKAMDEAAKKAGQTCLGHSEYNDALGMISSLQNHAVARDLLTGGAGIVEGSLFWKDPTTGVLCKTRPDRIRNDGIVVELKTTEDASPEEFKWSIKKYRYHVQGAFQIDGTRAVLGLDPKYFVIVAVEKKPPYAVSVYAIAARALQLGRGLYMQNLIAVKHCESTGIWPGYSDDITTLDLPERAYDEVME